MAGCLTSVSRKLECFKPLMDYFIYLLYRFFTGSLERLPLKVVFYAGRLLGTPIYYLAGKYRRLVLANLTIAFVGEKTPRQIRAIARDHFATLGSNLLSSFKLAAMTREEVMALTRWENLESVTDILDQGKGVIAVISHIGNWELFARMPQYVPQYSFSTVYQKLGNRFIDARVKRARARQGVHPFERKEGFNGPLKFIRDGGGLAILVDQHAGDAGLWTPFFNRLASTSPLAATLAIRTGAPVVPVAVYTDGPARWKFIVSPPIHVGQDRIEIVTAAINQSLEKQIMVSPQDWFWVHNRWKTPNPKFLLATYKRGVSSAGTNSLTPLKPFRMLLRSSNWLGDAVMTVPAVRAIKRGRPDAQVTILTRAKLADFWKQVPEVDAVISIEKDESIFQVAKKISVGFDAAILFPNSIRSGLEVWLADIPRRVGFESTGRNPFLNQILRKQKSGRPPEHQFNHYLQLAEFIGADIQGNHGFESRPSNTRTPYRIGLCPGAEYGPAKRWLPERFKEVITSVSQQIPCEWVMFGTDKDRAIGDEILGQPPKAADSIPLDNQAPDIASEEIPVADFKNCTNRIGQTTLAELMTELSQCNLLLTNDTGTMHLAAFLGVPTVSIFGSTEPALTGPMGSGHRVLRHHVECSPCFQRECPLDFRCMKSVEVNEVVEAVLHAL